jgi:prophage antirepressor-like protein
MKPHNFQNGSLVLDAYLLNNGEYVFQGASTCVDCGLSDIEHAARYIRNFVPFKWIEEINTGIGRPALYLYEPGLYYLLTHATNPDCFHFRDWVFEEVLPNVRKQGFHIDSEAVLADRSKLEALEKQTESLRNQLEVAEQLNFQMREYIDSELGKAKQKAAEVATEKVTSEVKVEYQCYIDAVDGNPVVYAAEMKRQRDEAIADKQKIISDNAYRALSVRDHIRKELEHKFQRQLKEETLSVPKEETLQIPKQSQP